MFETSRAYFRKGRAGSGMLRPAILFRYYGRWKASLLADASPMGMRIPWLTFPAIGRLKRSVRKGARVFEYGGGGSTLFFLDRGSTVVTAEHDPDWFALLQEHIGGEDLAGRWTGLLLPPAPAAKSGVAGQPADPDAYVSNDPKYEGLWFKDYAAAIDAYPDGHFDVVLVDGRSRPSCVKHAVAKVKEGGLLVLDNTERGYYLTAATGGTGFDGSVSVMVVRGRVSTKLRVDA